MNPVNQHSIGLSLHWEECIRQQQYTYCLEHQLAMEIIAFAWHDLWNDHRQRQECVLLYERELRNVPLPCSLHGPFQDIVPHALDRDVRRIAEERVKETLEIGERLGIRRFVVHTGINTVVTDPKYYEEVVGRQVEFWSKIVAELPDVLICLENMWEPSPSLQLQILDTISSPQVKACLDIGHANVYSKVPLRQWIEELSPHLCHSHIHDNNGDVDAHLTVGSGTTRWTEFFDLAQSSLEDTVLILELDSIEKQRSSMDFLAGSV